MTTPETTVFVVDDDEEALASVHALVRSMGVQALPFTTAEAFLDFYHEDSPGCLVTDVRMVGMSGIELQQEMQDRGIELPVIVLTAFARTSLTVKAMQNGAVTLLDKPYDDDDLWDAIRLGLQRDQEMRAKRAQQRDLQDRMALLTPSERKVMDLVVAGLQNKSIAKQLDVSVRTVENRRREVFAKMQAVSVAELVRQVIAAGAADVPANSSE
jgi:FixJ family two-component response regulator